MKSMKKTKTALTASFFIADVGGFSVMRTPIAAFFSFNYTASVSDMGHASIAAFYSKK